MTLVIMAAGMGSRFGGLKQIEPVGPNGEFIIDYSIYDAIRCGFDKVVFIIKEENYDIFKDTIGKRFEGKIDVSYVFQNMEDIPTGFSVPNDRVKPWGTGQAILACKDIIDEDFAIINADDFYGYDAYLKASNYMKDIHDENEYAMIGYKIGNTLTENGSVKRGYCKQNDGYLTDLIESKASVENERIVLRPLNGASSFIATDNDLVSMNMFIFNVSIFDHLEKLFIKFFEDHKDDLINCEYLVPDVVSKLIHDNKVKVKVVDTDALWHGITYKEDKEDVVKSINSEIDNGVYPNKLND